jgi:hypothetical protein
MSVSVDSVTPWGKREDWCGDASCGVTQADDLRVLLRYEVSVPDDFQGDFDPSRCPGELTVVNGNDDEAVRPYQDLQGETSDISGSILPGASKFGVAGFAVSKDYEDQEFVLTSACGTGEPSFTLADYAGLDSDEFENKIREVQEANDDLQKGTYIGLLTPEESSARTEDSTTVDDQGSDTVAKIEDGSLGIRTILPTDGELTEVVGVKWNSGSADISDAQSRLSNELAEQRLPGDVEGVSPSVCAVSAIAAGTGLPVDLQDSFIEHATAFRQPTSDIAYNRLSLWGVDAYLLKSGEAERLMGELADAGVTCQEDATVLSASGTPIPFGAVRSLDARSGPSGTAYVAYSSLVGPMVTEAIGDVLYVHHLNSSIDYLDQVGTLYNAKMDELASQMGVQRKAVALG